MPSGADAKKLLGRILDRYIPAARAAGIARPPDPSADLPAGESPTAATGSPAIRRILVVEDSYIEAQAMARLLEESSGFGIVGPVGCLD